MPTPEQLRLALEQKASSGHTAFTPQQITDRAIKEDSFMGSKIRRAMDLGVTKQQALNFYAYGTANGKLEEPQQKTGFFDNLFQDIQNRRMQAGEAVERFHQGEQGALETGFQVAGRGTQLAGDLTGRAIAPALKQLPQAIGRMTFPMVPQQTMQQATDYAGKKIIEGAGQALSSDPAQPAIKFYQGLSPRAQANIESAAAIGLAALDVIPGAQVAPRVLRETGEAALKGGRGALRTVFKPKAAKEILSEVDAAVGQIIQGDRESIKAARSALQTLDTTGVRTYQDLNKVMENKVSALVERQNQLLGKQDGVHRLDSFAVTSEAGDVAASSNPVANALEHLQEWYLKSGNMDDYVRIKAFRQRAEAEGMTAIEVNDLAREYGVEFSGKAFNARTGDPLTSVNAQLSENTRMGVKEAARSLLPDDASKLLDEQMSNLFDTLRLTKNVENKVLALAQKVTQRGLVERIGRGIGRTLDLATFGGLRGFLTSLFPSNVGLKMMNYLQIQERLGKNLSTLNDLLQKIDTLPPDKAANEVIKFMRVGERESRLIELKGGKEGRPGIDRAAPLPQEQAQMSPSGGRMGDVSTNNTRSLTQRQEGTLAAIHNINASKLRKADEIGGLPNPSIAIYDPSKYDFDGFGDISLVAPKDLIFGKGAQTFGADVYSPRFPTIETHVTSYTKAEQAAKNMGVNMADLDLSDFYRNAPYNNNVLSAFLKRKGIMANEGDYLPDLVKPYQAEFDKFVSDLGKEMGVTERVFKGYTPAGNRSYMEPVTAQNVSKMMNKEAVQGGEGFNYGLGSVRAKVAPRFKNVAEMKKKKDLLVGTKEFEQLKKQYDDEFMGLIDELNKHVKHADSNQFIQYDRTAENIGEYIAGDRSVLTDFFDNVPDSLVKKLDNFGARLAEMPTEYFETKFKRVVDPSEFSHALVPESTPDDVVEILTKRGVSVVKYSKKEGRQAALRKLLAEKGLLLGLGALFVIATE